jgi:hypothetical protein
MATKGKSEPIESKERLGHGDGDRRGATRVTADGAAGSAGSRFGMRPEGERVGTKYRELHGSQDEAMIYPIWYRGVSNPSTSETWPKTRMVPARTGRCLAAVLPVFLRPNMRTIAKTQAMNPYEDILP